MSQTQGELEVVGTELGGEGFSGGGEGQDGKVIEGRSLGRIAWDTLKRDKTAMAAGIVLVIIILVAIFAPLICKALGIDPNEFHSELVSPDTNLPFGAFGGSTGQHLLGVEPINGRDVLARILYGARTSLVIGVLATLLSLLIGVTLGLLAGYYRRWVDTIISWTMDTLLSFPVLLFMIALLAVFTLFPSFLGLSGQPLKFGLIIFVLGFFGWPYIGRIVRGQVLSLREKEFVDAARSLGATDRRIITREILPNLVGPILVYATLTIPNNILGEAGLSYLGIGLNPPTSSWGQMLDTAGRFYQVDFWFLLWPGLALFITVLAFNLFGDGLRDALDPRSTR
jgi:peptide/nickel transport system permease protein